MEKYFYRDANSQRRGPYEAQQLKTLAQQGIITPTTPLETDRQYLGLAGQFLGMEFNSATPQTPSKRITSQEMLQTLPLSPFFDIGFTRFITNTWTSILWVLSIGTSFLGCGSAMLFAIAYEAYILLFIAPVAAALFLLFMRIAFEITIVLFRIETHLRTIRNKYENK